MLTRKDRGMVENSAFHCEKIVNVTLFNRQYCVWKTCLDRFSSNLQVFLDATPKRRRFSTCSTQTFHLFSTRYPAFEKPKKPCATRVFQLFHTFRSPYYYDYDLIYKQSICISVARRKRSPHGRDDPAARYRKNRTAGASPRPTREIRRYRFVVVGGGFPSRVQTKQPFVNL